CSQLQLRHEIRLRRVSFSYAAKAPPAVEAIDIVLPAGEMTAIVGPSGAGKSTIADLLIGLISPDSGVIEVDDVAMAVGAAAGWSNQVGYVGHDSFLF